MVSRASKPRSSAQRQLCFALLAPADSGALPCRIFESPVSLLTRFAGSPTGFASPCDAFRLSLCVSDQAPVPHFSCDDSHFHDAYATERHR